MLNNLIFFADKISKGDSLGIGDGAIYSIFAILMVFAILLIIIGITTLVFKLTGLFEMKAEIDAAKKAQNASNNAVSAAKPVNGPVTISDDDMMAAVLVATIDYRNEIKKDVRVISVREVK